MFLRYRLSFYYNQTTSLTTVGNELTIDLKVFSEEVVFYGIGIAVLAMIILAPTAVATAGTLSIVSAIYFLLHGELPEDTDI